MKSDTQTMNEVKDGIVYNGKKQAVNPYLPSWEYIPDAEPYVFDGRVYVYGSHDRVRGHAYCLNDYVCWSAPEDDLGNWRYEGVIYKKTQDPVNEDGRMSLFAPDVTVGPDGRYYLYYVLNKVSIVSVAVCDTPAGAYEFYGYVHYPDGTRLGEREGDEPQFDPGVLTEGEVTYLYTGFCGVADRSRTGPMGMMLDRDMLTILEGPVRIAPSEPYSAGSGYEGHEFFEAPSIRKRNGVYYFVYSSVVMHELCYATSIHPLKDFVYRGVIISNCDLHIINEVPAFLAKEAKEKPDAINIMKKPPQKPMIYGYNNHGSIVEICGKWYIFYHRHTDGTNFSRQGCIEELTILEDGTILQAPMTSCGANGGPLAGIGEYPASIACRLFTREDQVYTGFPGNFLDSRFPRITQDGRDGDEEPGYISNMRDGATAGFQYFRMQGVRRVSIKVRGYCSGSFHVKTTWSGQSLGEIPVGFTDVWTEYSAPITIPDGITGIYFEYQGEGGAALLSFALEA